MFRRDALRDVGRRHSENESAWTPAAITNLFEWWIAEPAYLAYDGANRVSAWSGAYAGRTLTQGTLANQPIYSSSDATCNNKPSITFDGSGDYLQDSGSGSDWGFWTRTDAPGGASDALVLVVARYSSASTDLRRMLGADTGTTNATRLADSVGGTGTLSFGINGWHGGVGWSGAGGIFPAVQTLFWYAASVPCATSGTQAVVGTGRTYLSGAHSSSANTTDPATTMRVGDHPGFRTWPGQICEVAFAKTQLTSALAAQLQSYVTARYGL